MFSLSAATFSGYVLPNPATGSCVIGSTKPDFATGWRPARHQYPTAFSKRPPSVKW
jgi:hypothetical protein